MKKSIAIICEYSIFPRRLGGMDRFFVAYNEELKNQGFIVTWFFKDVITFDFYNNLRLLSAKGNNLEQFFLYHLKTKGEDFEIVLTHFLQPVSSFYKEIKIFLPQTKIINVDHNPRPLQGFPLTKRIKNKIKGLLYGRYIDKLVGVSDYTTNYILKDFGKHLKKKAKTIYNGIDISSCEKQVLDRSSGPFQFLVVSHLRKSKGIQDLLKALTLVDSKILNRLSVSIYGEGPYKDELLELTKKYGLNNCVCFQGSSPNINQLLCGYHYLIQPTYMECFSLSLLESLACNVPVITTTVGGNLELITNEVNGFIFPPMDCKLLAEIISKIVLKESVIYEDVSILIEQEFTLEKMVTNHIELIKCI